MKTNLLFYVGSPEHDPFGTYMYLDLQIVGFDQVTLAETERLDNLSEIVLVQEVEKLVNRASVFSNSLRLPVHTSMEEIYTMCVELECSDESRKLIGDTIREFLAERKGDLKNDSKEEA